MKWGLSEIVHQNYSAYVAKAAAQRCYLIRRLWREEKYSPFYTEENVRRGFSMFFNSSLAVSLCSGFGSQLVHLSVLFLLWGRHLPRCLWSQLYCNQPFTAHIESALLPFSNLVSPSTFQVLLVPIFSHCGLTNFFQPVLKTLPQHALYTSLLAWCLGCLDATIAVCRLVSATCALVARLRFHRHFFLSP